MGNGDLEFKQNFIHGFISIFSANPDAFGLLSLSNKNIVLANECMDKFFTLKDEEKRIADLIPKNDLAAFELFIEELIQQRQANLTCKLYGKDKVLFDGFIRACCLNGNQALIHIIDVSSEMRKKEEESQRKWINYFEHLFANSKDIMNLFSMTQRKILRWNPQAGIMMGYTKEDLENTPIESIYPPEELLKLGGTFQRLAEHGFAEEKLKIFNKKKELKDIWTRAFVVQYEPEVLCLVHTIDITEEKERERNLLKEARLSALGEASATLAHEINNALQSSISIFIFCKAKNSARSAKNA
jgi:PAS domain S-box-containing protein